MEKVYQQLGTPDGDTDYFIWRTRTETERKGHAQAQLQGLTPPDFCHLVRKFEV
jgi:hypothetical protein